MEIGSRFSRSSVAEHALHTKLLSALWVFLIGGVALFAATQSFAADIVIVKSARMKIYNDAADGIEAACRCKTLTFDMGEGDNEYLLSRIKDVDPSAIIAVGAEAYNHLLKIIKNTPLIYSMTIAPELGPSLPHNVYGVSMTFPGDLYISVIQEMFAPQRSRLGILYSDETEHIVRDLKAAARNRGIESVVRKVGNGRDFLPALQFLHEAGVNMVLLTPDTSIFNNYTIDALVRFSAQHRIPFFGFSKRMVELGAVAGFYAEPYDIGLLTGELINSVLINGNRGVHQVVNWKPKILINPATLKQFDLHIAETFKRKVEEVRAR